MTSYKALRTPVQRGVAAWSALLPGQPVPVALDGDRTADFAVVGGGFAGLSAAERLRQLNPGAKVVVLEAGRLAVGMEADLAVIDPDLRRRADAFFL